jgi:hypothetical protein
MGKGEDEMYVDTRKTQSNIDSPLFFLKLARLPNFVVCIDPCSLLDLRFEDIRASAFFLLHSLMLNFLLKNTYRHILFSRLPLSQKLAYLLELLYLQVLQVQLGQLRVLPQLIQRLELPLAQHAHHLDHVDPFISHQTCRELHVVGL